jgi:large subunit ribosomal protein L3
MMSALLGRKVGITSGYDSMGEPIPVSVIQAGPCKVLSLRTPSKEGYDAAVLGFEEIEGAKVKSKPLLGLFKKLGTSCYRVIREFRGLKAEVGAEIKVDQFKPGEIVEVEGVSKGHGWSGVIKKWNFSRGRMSHGGNCKRKMGSSGMHTWPAHVIKGKKMSGRWGSENVSMRSVEVVSVIPEENLILVKGPVPGGRHGLLKIQKLGKVAKLRTVQKEVQSKDEKAKK